MCLSMRGKGVGIGGEIGLRKSMDDLYFELERIEGEGY